MKPKTAWQSKFSELAPTGRPMAVAIASLILLGATPTPAPVRVTLNDLVGKWVTVSGDCSQGQHLFSANGKYKVWCFDSISEGEWSLRGGNKIVKRRRNHHSCTLGAIL
jgi:hypothetical protein